LGQHVVWVAAPISAMGQQLLPCCMGVEGDSKDRVMHIEVSDLWFCERKMREEDEGGRAVVTTYGRGVEQRSTRRDKEVEL